MVLLWYTKISLWLNPGDEIEPKISLKIAANILPKNAPGVEIPSKISVKIAPKKPLSGASWTNGCFRAGENQYKLLPPWRKKAHPIKFKDLLFRKDFDKNTDDEL